MSILVDRITRVIARRVPMMGSLLCLGAGLLAATASPAQEYEGGPLIILSDEDGRGMTIGAQVDSRTDYVPADLSGRQIADEFKRLCLDTNFDKAALSAAADTSELDFTQSRVALPATGKLPAFDYDLAAAPSARAGIWLGDDTGLKGRPILIRTRGALVASGYGPFKARGRQCNFDLKVRGLVSAEELAARISEHVGGTPAKLVLKSSFADGHWTFSRADGIPLRLSFDVVDMNKPRQLVHIVLQEVVGKTK
jgi:hypothetical protein